MSTHTRRAFLNSCLKVPIDPCNNCPAPVYNRPKMCLGRLTATPASNTAKIATANSTKTSGIEADIVWSNSDIRSLAKLYDSIPDYYDINHLPEEEFYSTLDSLRTTCKSLNSCTVEENNSSNTTTSSSPHCPLGLVIKTKKLAKKKSSSSKNSGKKKSSQKKVSKSKIVPACAAPEVSCIRNIDSKKIAEDNITLKSFKEDLEDEIEAFKRTLEEYEKQFKRPVTSHVYRPQTTSFNARQRNREKTTSPAEESSIKDTEKEPEKRGSPSGLRDTLKKSYSFDDINSIGVGEIGKNAEDIVKKPKKYERLPKAESLAYKDPGKLSNYFAPKPNKTAKEERKSPANTVLPKIVVDTPDSETPSSKLSHDAMCGRKKKSKSKLGENIKVPFTLFDLSTTTKKENVEPNSPSPVYPVARPNLAATLRAEVAKKKLNEIQNNCTYPDTTPQFDWEVRKTPAWKSLTMNESHKQILSLRLATRKAEQALQQREYELHMELMRQRVKSAPLLLEGPTYWGPNVGKLTHKCQNEGVKHECGSRQTKHHKKRASNRRDRCESGTGSRMSHRINTLRKIYANCAQSYSRNSYHSTTSRRGEKRQQREPQNEQANDSGDELSSLDRAFL